jgi:hypothetical protein
MFRRLILLVLFLATACQSGIIPCPRVKTVKAKKTVIHKHFHESTASLSANASEDARAASTSKTHHSKNSKNSDIKVVGNVTVEEWDCPRPGRRKYMPKTVKENIRKNLKKIKADDKNETDSTAITPPETIQR